MLSPSNSQTDMDDKRARCASGKKSAIAMIRTFALEKTHGALPVGVHPLHPANYLLTGKWTPKDSTAISMELPFPIHIPWPDLEF